MAVGNGTTELQQKPAVNGHDVTVKVTDTSTVFPRKKPEQQGSCPLATFDLPYITFYYNQKLMVYRMDEEAWEKYGDVVAKLKDALAAALEHFYPLAGSLKQDKDRVLQVEHGDQHGVEVLEATAPEVDVAKVADAGVDEKLMQEMIPYTGVMNLEGFDRPLLAIQFTKLKDGIAIGSAFNHAILDGNSTWHFMSTWADLCRDATANSAPSLLPIHDRLLARATRVPLDLPVTPAAHEGVDPNGPPKPLVPRLFSFPAQLIAKLKSSTNAGLPPEAKQFSTFQSLGAHVWRAVTRARELPPDAITAFAIFADCRARVDPPLPSSYFGNLIQAVFTGIPAGMLLAAPAQVSAGMLQKAIDAHDAAAIVKRLEEYEQAPKLFHYSDAGPNCVAVGSSPRFKVYDVDFGFGKPERVRSGKNNKFDGMVYLYPSRDGDGGIDVELTLQPEAMQRLEKDDEFLPKNY